MSESDLKRQRRLEKNRVSARKSRQKKRDRAEALTHKLRVLEAENLELRLSLKVGPEHEQMEVEQSQSLISKLKDTIAEGNARDSDIKGQIESLQEKFSDYGRDRQSSFEFYMTQLQRCLRPTQTTRTMLWLLSNASNFLNSDGSDRETPICEDDTVKELWSSLIRELKPTNEQRKKLLILNNEAPTPFTNLKAASDDCQSLMQQLRGFVSDKNSSLDSHMRSLSSSLTPTQVAKFIFFADKNPSLLQLVDKLLPNLRDREYDGEGALLQEGNGSDGD